MANLEWLKDYCKCLDKENAEKYGPPIVAVVGLILVVLAFAVAGDTACTDECSNYACVDKPLLCNVLNCTQCVDHELDCEPTFSRCIHSSGFYLLLFTGLLCIGMVCFAYCRACTV